MYEIVRQYVRTSLYISCVLLSVIATQLGTAQSCEQVVQTISCSSVKKARRIEYEIFRRTPEESNRVNLDILVSRSSAAQGEALAEIGCMIGEQFSRFDGVDAWIFDDKTAARNLALYEPDQGNWPSYVQHLRAYYARNSRTGEQSVVYRFYEVTPPRKFPAIREVKLELTP